MGTAGPAVQCNLLVTQEVPKYKESLRNENLERPTSYAGAAATFNKDVVQSVSNVADKKNQWLQLHAQVKSYTVRKPQGETGVLSWD